MKNRVLAGLNKKCAHMFDLEIQSTQNMIQMALASNFSTCGCQICETPSMEFVQQQLLGFFNQGEPNQK